MNTVHPDLALRHIPEPLRRGVIQEIAVRRSRLKKRWNAFIFCTFTLIIVVARFPAFNQPVNKVIAPITAGIFIFQFRHYLRRLPAEYYCFAGFLLWSLSGYPAALEKGYFIEYFTLIFQIFILMLVVFCHGKLQNNLRIFHIVYMLNVWVFFLTSLLTGEVSLFGDGATSGRVFGLVVSPNGYGYVMFLGGVSALLFLSKKKRSAFLNVFLTTVLVMSTLGIIWSASRKAFIGWVIFAALWVVMNLGANIARNVFAGLGVLLISTALWFGVKYIMEETYIGQRFHKLEAEDTYLGRNRTILYQESFEVFRKHPLTGVGLSNFQVYSSLGGYTHSDYMEVVTNTGIPGLILYLGFYLVIINRLLKTLNHPISRDQMIYSLNLLCFIGIYLALGIGRPNFTSIFSMSYMAMVSMESIFIVNSINAYWAQKQRVRHRSNHRT